MAVLERQHPGLKMDELAVGVTEYMNEEVAKEGREEVRPNAIEEATFPPIPTPTNVAKTSTLLHATRETLPASLFDNQVELDLPTDLPSL